MGVTEIRNHIDILPVTGNTAEDIQTASIFIKDFLYDQEIAIATAVINEDLRKHFGIEKMRIWTSLMHVYKDAAKKYQDEILIKKYNDGETIPSWYKFTKNGISLVPGVLAQVVAEDELLIYVAEQYYIYRNGVYQAIADAEVQYMCKQRMLKSEVKMRDIVDTENQVRLLSRKSTDQINPDPMIINVKNGLYSVHDDTLVDHTPDYYSTIQLNANYNQTADCPQFKKYLFEIMDGDMTQVTLIQEILGYLLVPITKAQKCFILTGAAGSGKSVLLRVVNEILLGKKNVSHIAWQSLNERFKLAELYGKLANTFADLPSKKLEDNGIFKALVGEDDVTAEKKNKDPFTFKSTARLLFSCNNLPFNNGDKSDGFFRRLIIIPFSKTIPEDKRDPYLVDKLQKEADGIFMFALAGLRRLMQQEYRFSVTDVNQKALKDYREGGDSVIMFIRDNCKFAETAKIGSTVLYNHYQEFCQKQGLSDVSQGVFVNHILSNFNAVSRGKDHIGQKRILKGIDFCDDEK